MPRYDFVTSGDATDPGATMSGEGPRKASAGFGDFTRGPRGSLDSDLPDSDNLGLQGFP